MHSISCVYNIINYIVNPYYVELPHVIQEETYKIYHEIRQNNNDFSEGLEISHAPASMKQNSN